jgi:branched-chain amino acid transport system substrate-binding protein
MTIQTEFRPTAMANGGNAMLPNQSTRICMLAAVGALLTLFAAPASSEILGDAVRVGVMSDMSGPYADNGGPRSVIAAKMAVEDFGGTVNGHPIEILTADDQNKADVGFPTVRKWLDVDKVDAIIGGSASSIALAVQTLMKERQKPYLLAGTMSSELTGKSCSPMTIQFLADIYAQPKAAVRSLLKQGIKTFYFITVDYTFGHEMQSTATRFIEEGGGQVIGSVKHALGTSDFSSYLLQAQHSGAQAIVLASAGHDTATALKQAKEFGLGSDGQIVTAFGMTINAITAMGLEVAQGLKYIEPFYWDRDEDSKAWSKRFMERTKGAVPTWIHAATYSAMMHYLKAVQAADSDAGPDVIAKMKAMPINDFEMKNVKIREDGQVMRPVYAIQVKSPAESKGDFDYFKVGDEIPPEEVFRPLSEGGCDFINAGKH